MASPFPGMDPYLEGEMWQEFHETLADAIRAQLMPRLTPKFVALLAKRYALDRSALGIVGLASERLLCPDVHVVEPPACAGMADRLAARPAALPAGAGVDVIEPAVELPSPMAEEVPLLAESKKISLKIAGGGRDQMKYLGIVKRRNKNLTMPDTFEEIAEERIYEAIQVGDDIFLLPTPLAWKRLKRIEELANRSIEEHRSTLEGLAPDSDEPFVRVPFMAPSVLRGAMNRAPTNFLHLHYSAQESVFAGAGVRPLPPEAKQSARRGSEEFGVRGRWSSSATA